jgi:hypothetical protein
MLKRKRRAPWITIYGHIPGADHVLCAIVRGESDAVSSLGILLDDPAVTFIEVLRYRSLTQSEAEIRNVSGRSIPRGKTCSGRARLRTAKKVAPT